MMRAQETYFLWSIETSWNPNRHQRLVVDKKTKCQNKINKKKRGTPNLIKENAHVKYKIVIRNKSLCIRDSKSKYGK
jgi:hypothetical protein